MKILITAGPTREAIDPVRYLSNRSSGKMGYALAEAAVARGHEVLLISGPVSLPAVEGANTIKVITASEMYDAVQAHIGEAVDAAIFCAAVADYRPACVEEHKIKKDDNEQITLVLEKTADILGSVRGKMDFTGLLIGFAAETEKLESYARRKLQSKQCDLIVANHVGDAQTGFDADDNQLQLFFADGQQQKLPLQTKRLLGEKVIEIIEKMGEPKT